MLQLPPSLKPITVTHDVETNNWKTKWKYKVACPNTSSHVLEVSSSMKHPMFLWPLYLQSGDNGPPDQAGESGRPSPQSDLFTPPVGDIQVTDVFYEDTVNTSPLETTTIASTVSAAAVLPGQICLEEIFLFTSNILVWYCSSMCNAGEEFKLINI